jgi:FkbM family methyltransferase
MLLRIASSLNYRVNLSKHGIYYLSKKDFNISKLKIRGKRVEVSFPEDERATLEYELYLILIDDCYCLKKLKGKINTVLDIGANIGLFSLAAGYYFPKATIHSYEPNFKLRKYLNDNCHCIEAQYFLEAVGIEDTFVNLNFGENSLHSVVANSSSGEVSCIAFNKAVQKIGGAVDLVKLDCEGAEWELFEDIETWSKIRYLTMEYHLWAKPGYSIDDLFNRLSRIGFQWTKHNPSPCRQWGLVQAYNKKLCHSLR